MMISMMTPWRLVAAALWLVTSVGLLVAWQGGMPELAGVLQLAGIAYILLLMALIWNGQPAPRVSERPDTRIGFWPMLVLVVVSVALIFVLGRYVHPWLLLALATGLAGLVIIWRERKSVTPLAVVVALAAAALCFGLNAASGKISSYHAIYLGMVPAMFLGGALLVRRVGLLPVTSAEGNWRAAARMFVWGMVLALPPALVNIGAGAHSGDHWVTELWEPLVALSAGIAEESMARLLLLTLCFFLLAGRRGASVRSALAAAILIAALAHAFAHVPTSQLIGPAGGMMLLAGLLFGVPMGLVFVRFGFEAAVAYHFFIDFVRFAAAYVAT